VALLPIFNFKTMQKHLFESDGKKIVFIESHPIESIGISQHNPRRTWDEKHVERLAQLIGQNGYDSTYAIKCYQDGDKLMCFAGSNRLKAMQRLGQKSIPVFLYQDCTTEQLCRMAYEDNEQADAQQPFSMVDVWMDYKAKADAGWKQQKIADVLGVTQANVSYRISFASFSKDVLAKIITTPILNERHCREFLELSPGDKLTQGELLCNIIDDVLSRSKEPTSKHFKAEVEKYNKYIETLDAWAAKLEPPHLEAFLSEAKKTRSAAQAESFGHKHYEAQAYVKAQEVQALQAKLEELEADEARRLREIEKGKKRQAVLDRILLGDARELAAKMPEGTKAIFTDPPYGVAYQSNRRVKTEKAPKIANDQSLDVAVSLFSEVIRAAYPRLADDAALFAWCDWDTEPVFRAAIEAAGYKMKNSIIWVKNNHGTGDLEGTFAPKHERLLFAVKGRPLLNTRPPDVLHGGEFLDTEHPTPKPVDLIEKVIEAITFEGDYIADPFMGSCPVGVAAIRSGRKFWGCDLEKQWWDEAQTNISKLIEE
jgi:site-specific DNA-methyltransferase (adenine-specific)